MKLPPFEDFAKTITDEDIQDWLTPNVFSINDISDKLSKKQMTDILVRTAYYSSLGLVKHYHNWLSEQLRSS